MDILHLIDRLEEMLAEARRVPVGGGVIISRQKMADLIDRMRVAVPREVYDSREVVEQRDEVLRQAQEEATALLAQAKDELEKRLGETEIVKAADDRAHEIIAEAESRARDLGRESEQQARERLDEAQSVARTEMREADAYALQTLRKLETDLEAFITAVRKGVDTLEMRSADRPKD